MDNIKLLAQAYRAFLLELGEAFQLCRDNEEYVGFADTFIDAVKSPEIGFTPSEVQTLIKMYDMFCLLEPTDLPSHHSMKVMATKKVDMDLLSAAQTLSVTDFKESIKDKELGTQDRTYKYEIIKRAVESGSIKKVYGEELEEAVAQLQKNPDGFIKQLQNHE
jgi:hypothetical protein